jgi:hypothetical protein
LARDTIEPRHALCRTAASSGECRYRYPELLARGVSVTGASSYQAKRGSGEGRKWPTLDPCKYARAAERAGEGDMLVRMLATWQQRARREGFPGLHVVGTVGGQGGVDAVAKLPAAADLSGVMQFLPHPLGAHRAVRLPPASLPASLPDSPPASPPASLGSPAPFSAPRDRPPRLGRP